ncbi:FAD-dependent oxidoreductase [Cryptosporangium arvum]|uniref:FAD-dependent oxidoreductase n=1 Tax=Cryptosporangium arvum TaxID=80871 RepID=UPI0004ADC8FF|nr:FAD-dependent oxidoreductase [Cryptosporangium arvum]
MPDFDVAIVGAGPAGAATALRLARAGARVLLLERSHFENPRVGESLSPEVTPLLRELGVDLPAARPSYGVASHWGGTESSSTLSNPHGTGWYVDRAAFDRHLAEAAAAAGADLRLGTACLGAVRATQWTLTLSGGASATADFLVDATGRAARLGRHLGAERLAFDRLVAITAFVPAPDPGGFGLVETVPAGWCYSAPAGPGHLVTMLLTDADLGRDGSLTTVERWRASLGPHTAARLNDAPIGDLRTISAASQRLHRPRLAAEANSAEAAGAGAGAGAGANSAGTDPARADPAGAAPGNPADAAPGNPAGAAAGNPAGAAAAGRRDGYWLAVGDAALAQDPITGTGVLRALRSAATAAEVLLGTDPHRFPAAGLPAAGLPAAGLPAAGLAAYEAALDQECTAYLHRRLSFYAAETRWPDAPFWQRRLRTLSARRTSA